MDFNSFSPTSLTLERHKFRRSWQWFSAPRWSERYWKDVCEAMSGFVTLRKASKVDTELFLLQIYCTSSCENYAIYGLQ